MKAATVLSLVLAGAMSAGTVYAETDASGLQKLKERWEKRHTEREALREKLEAELKTQDAALEKVQADLKAAKSEDKKVEALTAAVNTLIDQRREMHKRMEDFGDKMRRHSSEMKGGTEQYQKGPDSTLPGTPTPETAVPPSGH